jgi:hypothetical protein
MYVGIGKNSSLFMTSHHVLIKQSDCQEVGTRTTFETGADFDHPISHFCAKLPRDVMTFQRIWTGTQQSSFLLFSTKQTAVVNYFFGLKGFLNFLNSLAVNFAAILHFFAIETELGESF